MNEWSSTDWLSAIGAVLSGIGLVATLVSLGVVVYQVPKARRAAEDARKAALEIGSVVAIESCIARVTSLGEAIDQEEQAVALHMARELRLELVRLVTRGPKGLALDQQEQLRGYVDDLTSLESELRRRGVSKVKSSAIQLGNLTNLLAEVQEEIRSKAEL